MSDKLNDIPALQEERVLKHLKEEQNRVGWPEKN